MELKFDASFVYMCVHVCVSTAVIEVVIGNVMNISLFRLTGRLIKI